MWVACARARTRRRMFRGNVPRARSYGPAAAADSDSESEDERSWSEPRTRPRGEAGRCAGRRSGPWESRHIGRAARIGRERPAPIALAEHGDRAGGGAAVVAGEAGGGRLLAMAVRRRRLVAVAPRPAEGCDALTGPQRQHDGKDDCSRHGTLAAGQRKTCASRQRSPCAGKSACLSGTNASFLDVAGDFADELPEIPQRAGSSRALLALTQGPARFRVLRWIHAYPDRPAARARLR